MKRHLSLAYRARAHATARGLDSFVKVRLSGPLRDAGCNQLPLAPRVWQRLNAEYAQQFGSEDENMKKSGVSQAQSASELISKRIAELGDWRGKTLGRMRKLIKDADPDVIEEWKWVNPTKPGTPVWSHDGIICTGESYKSVVKLTFAKGASLKDPARLFNSSLDGNVRRAIDIHEGEEVDESAFKALVRQAVVHNSSGKSKT
jgi:hypothetical protein